MSSRASSCQHRTAAAAIIGATIGLAPTAHAGEANPPTTREMTHEDMWLMKRGAGRVEDEGTRLDGGRAGKPPVAGPSGATRPY